MEQSDAIVLRVFPWSETSCVASLYTRENGKLSVLAKGARRPKSPFEAALDLLSICRVVFISKSSDALDILTEAKLVRRFRVGAQDLLRLYCGYYVAELLDKLTDKADKQPEIYDLAIATIHGLEDWDLVPAALILRFELQLLRMTGHLPTWDQCAQCGVANTTDETEATWRIFSALVGGVVCTNCSKGSRQTQRIPVQTLETMMEFSRRDWTEINTTQFATHQPVVVRKLIQRYLVTLLDRKCQLHDYLEELGR